MVIDKCNGCEIKFIDTPAYHRVLLEFKSYMIDANTGLEEEVTNMYRQSFGMLCPACYDIFTEELYNFIENAESTKNAGKEDCCSGCEKSIKSLPIRHEMNYQIKTFQKQNDNFIEIEPVQTISIVLCEECFETFMTHIDNFLRRTGGNHVSE